MQLMKPLLKPRDHNQIKSTVKHKSGNGILFIGVSGKGSVANSNWSFKIIGFVLEALLKVCECGCGYCDFLSILKSNVP